MRSRAQAASSAPLDRREPSLAREELVPPTPQPRLVQPERGSSARALIRAAIAPRFDLRAGERAVVASAEPVRPKGELANLLKKLGLAALVVLALLGAATLLRPLVGL